MGKVNCLRCRFRHEDNGNCTAVGGFCTAVQAAHCPLLREYLDTGLTPKRCAEFAQADAEGRYIVMRDAEQEGVARLRELAEADKDGRVVVLPCKEGDTVWMYGEDFGTVLPYTIDLISFVGKGCGYSANYNHNGELIDGIDFEDDDIGKTVFLTREEAEKALMEILTRRITDD